MSDFQPAALPPLLSLGAQARRLTLRPAPPVDPVGVKGRVLQVLLRAGEAMTVHDVAARARCERSRASVCLFQLTQDGLARKHAAEGELSRWSAT